MQYDKLGHVEHFKKTFSISYTLKAKVEFSTHIF